MARNRTPRGDAPAFTTPPTSAELEALAQDAFLSVPEVLRAHCRDIVVRIEEFPEDDVLRDLELESPFDLLGLYDGVPVNHRSVQDLPRRPDMIFLYRVPLLCYWVETGEDLSGLVRHVMIHEIGHHFGFSDDDMEELERQAP
ncbi:metallopeptidase family protein [Phaeovibrio sulfidiphilus]|uniref:Metallopeptidase family protein n=1 Tax=Phaeovibrio sulfidiphilus TaxID=1220600 RepID=A0A8J7CBX2_9PROT|nr:metallopeptidase family protein [Phaeovibrio sulfidiphilus]MBE1236633.1 metallopeptidase family protein [Phaeovibrio sulfidiphilus]